MYDDLLDEDISIPIVPATLPPIVRAATLWLLVMLAFFYAPFGWDILRGPVSGSVTIAVYGVLVLMALLFSVGMTVRAFLSGNWLLRTYATLHGVAWIWAMAFFTLEGSFVHMVGIALGGSLLMMLAEFHRQYTPKPWFWKGLFFVASMQVVENGISAFLTGYEVWQMQAIRAVSIFLYIGIGSYTGYQLFRYWRSQQFLRFYAIGSMLLAWVIAGIWHAVFHYKLTTTIDPTTFETVSYWTYPLISRLPLVCWVLYVFGLVAAFGARRLRQAPFDYPE